MAISDDSVMAQIKAAFRRLPLRPGSERRLERVALTLAGLTDLDPEAGRPPPRFREASLSTCTKELNRFSYQAKRLADLATAPRDAVKRSRAAKRLVETVDELHQPTILALADAGLGGGRLAVADVARHLADAESGASEGDVELLQYAAACARRSAVKPAGQSRLGRPHNVRVEVITGILCTEFRALTGRRPTITVDGTSVNNQATGFFVDLVREVFAALPVAANAEAAARAELRVRVANNAKRKGRRKKI